MVNESTQEISHVVARNINNKNMLSDESIDLAQQLLDRQFPDCAGFGDIALMERNGFDVIIQPNHLFKFCMQGLLTGYVLET